MTQPTTLNTKELAEEHGIGRDKVVQLINSVLERVEAQEDLSREKLYNEVRALQDLIEETRQEISATKVGDVSFKHIPNAAGELDAVIAATEAATGVIMDGCDNITAEAEKLAPAQKDFMLNEVTKILEACSFQDITGQRISKVTKNLKSIEEKVGALLKILAEKIPGLPHTSEDDDTRVGDERLKNGPQMPDKAVSQADIDKLLADLF